jgi:chromosome segregation ATPase
MNTLKTIETRLEKKSASYSADVRKIENLNAQITQYSNSVTRLEDGLDQKKAEVELLEGWKVEAEALTRSYDTLGSELEQTRTYYDQFEWAPDMADEQKLDYDLEYKKKLKHRESIASRLEEIEKLANKTYYRR